MKKEKRSDFLEVSITRNEGGKKKVKIFILFVD
jgi:hypothetical protein